MMKSWRTALRIARREAARAKGRAVLVVAMIALPVAALTFGLVNYDSYTLTPTEQADRQMGTAQALVAWPFDEPAHQDPTEFVFYAPGGPPQPGPAPTEDRLLALLPPGSRAVTDQAGRLTVHTATGTGTVNARMLDYGDPLARGIFHPLSGRPPATADEVALTPAATRRLGTGVGGTVRLADDTRTFRVVATVEDPGDLRAETIVLRPGALPATAMPVGRSAQHWLVAMPGPLTWAQIKQLNTHGVVALSRQVLAHPPSEAERYRDFTRGGSEPTAEILVLVGGLAMLEIVLLAGPAFAVGARRRRRDLALVAATGGTPAHVRRIVLADGVVLGILAAASGVVCGIAVAAATMPLIESHLSSSRPGAFRVFPLALAIVAGLAIVTGVLAAVVPAWISSRQDVVTALAGRRGITRSKRRWMIVGAVLVAAGATMATVGAWRINIRVILAGLVLSELGLVLCTPAIVGLVARLGRWLPVAPRIALRDTSRNRTAAAPAISAVMAAVVGSLAVGVVLHATDERTRNDYRTSGHLGDVGVFLGGKNGPDERQPGSTAALIRSTLPVERIYEVGFPTCEAQDCGVDLQMPAALACPYSPQVLQRDPTRTEQRAARRDHRCDGLGQMTRYFGGGVQSGRPLMVVVDDAAAGAVAGVSAEDGERAAAALRAGMVVVDDPRYLEGGRVTLNVFTPGPDRNHPGPSRTVTAPAFALPHRPQAPIAMLTKATASSLGLTSMPFLLLATTSRMPTVAEQDRLQAALGNGFGVAVERGPQTNNTQLIILAIVAAVITLAAAAIATGLAAADGRADLATLGAVGASPRLRRMLSLSQSGVIAGLGSLIGVAAGLGASTAVLAALNQAYADLWPAPTPYPIGVPWLNVGIALLVVPVVAMLGAGLLTRSRLPIERRL
ncbi:MAG: hypothetical protein AUI14_06520 [Actinobacteria bacterium 13_2_20CM_2_71_6]|nr:MAG: hypothetical protein AUI14_06520 [Actinobacteria bacterium 13_2_20CM_2_71_6]